MIRMGEEHILQEQFPAHCIPIGWCGFPIREMTTFLCHETFGTDENVDLGNNLQTLFLGGDDERRKFGEHRIKVSGLAEPGAGSRATQFETTVQVESEAGRRVLRGPSRSPAPAQIGT